MDWMNRTLALSLSLVLALPVNGALAQDSDSSSEPQEEELTLTEVVDQVKEGLRESVESKKQGLEWLKESREAIIDDAFYEVPVKVMGSVMQIAITLVMSKAGALPGKSGAIIKLAGYTGAGETLGFLYLDKREFDLADEIIAEVERVIAEDEAALAEFEEALSNVTPESKPVLQAIIDEEKATIERASQELKELEEGELKFNRRLENSAEAGVYSSGVAAVIAVAGLSFSGQRVLKTGFGGRIFAGGLFGAALMETSGLFYKYQADKVESLRDFANTLSERVRHSERNVELFQQVLDKI